MNRLLLAIFLTLGMAASVSADGLQQVVSPTTINPHWTVTVFNDQGAALTSGTVVAWDQDDTDFSTSMFPYVITTTTADDPYTAGVILNDSCPDQQLCEIVVYGPARVLVADSTDDAAVDTLVGTTTVAGQVGDYATGANTCALGTLISFEGAQTYNSTVGRVFVDVDCD